MRFIEDMSPDERMKYFENRRKQKERQQEQQALNDATEKLRYRCEQTVAIRVNSLIVNSADTKREFFVQRQNKNNQCYISINMVDNIITANPQGMMSGAGGFLVEFDNVKSSEVVVSIDQTTGKIERLVNHKDIIKKWEGYKADFQNKYSFFKSEANKKLRDNFIDSNDKIIYNEKLLIHDLSAKMFYDLFFGKYLITKEGLFTPYKREFNSHLFAGVQVVLDFTQSILSETPELLSVKKTGKLNKNYDLQAMKDIYAEKMQPQIGYKFSEYDYMMIDNTIMGLGNFYWIEKSDVNMIERVKNNIDVMVDYKLKRIEL